MNFSSTISDKVNGIRDRFSLSHIPVKRRVQARIVAVLLVALFGGAIIGAAKAMFTYTATDGMFAGVELFYYKRYYFCVLSAIWWVLLTAVPFKFNERFCILINAVMFSITPLVCFYIVETIGQFNKADFYVENDARKLILNMILYVMMITAFYVITGSVRMSVTLSLGISVLFACMNVFLVRFRNSPVAFSDLTLIGTALNVKQKFDFTPTPYMLAGGALALDIIFLVMKIKPNKYISRNIIFRVACLLVWLGFAKLFVGRTMNDEFLEEYAHIINFRPQVSYGNHGSMLGIYSTIRFSLVKKPGTYSADKVKKLESKYVSDTASDGKKDTNVIVVMNESYSDLQDVFELETNKPVMPFYDSLKENTIKGDTYVSVYAGKTADTEFEFLTGASKYFLPSGLTPYQNLVSEYLPSLTSTLRDDGYENRLAMHPYMGDGYRRDVVYDLFDFTRFITINDFKDPGKVHGFVSDEADYDKIIAEYEAQKKAGGGPFYVFNVTMQNHGGYAYDPSIGKEIEVTTEKLRKKDELQTYLNLIHKSDAAVKELVDYYKGVKEPTVIVFFGDHQPGVSAVSRHKVEKKGTEEYTTEEVMDEYKTPFFIWANFDIKEEKNVKSSPNYLRAKMLEVAGMPMTGYDKFLLDVQKEVPAVNLLGYFGEDGNFYEPDQKSPYSKTMENYGVLQYNMLFEGDDRSPMFELKK